MRPASVSTVRALASVMDGSHKDWRGQIIKKVEELTMKKTFFEKLSAMLTGYYKSFSMDF